MKIRLVGSLSFLIFTTIILIISSNQIYAGDKVKWKTFEEKTGLFTMKYPSNWMPSKSTNEEYPSLVGMDFIYAGGDRSDIASVSIIADESIFTNASDVVDTFTAALNSKFKLIQPMECTNYIIKGAQACSLITTYKETNLPGNPTVKEMDIVAIDEYGVQYTFIYGASKNLFDDFLPVAEEMIKSFDSGNILLPDGEPELATEELPALPPLSEAPTIKKL
ncbi:MAG TPA: hypothetical protein VIA08_04000 [Nitrososphaeraceae archaeon]|jgi:hypothetical protein